MRRTTRRVAGQAPGQTCKSVLFALVIGTVLGAGLASCARSKPVMNSSRINERKQELTALWMQIRDWRKEAGLRVEPDAQQLAEVRRQPVSQSLRTCDSAVPPRTPICDDMCSLKDAICDNATAICDIARELNGDSWAYGKCNSAKASCKEASERCCTCMHQEEGGTSTGSLWR